MKKEKVRRLVDELMTYSEMTLMAAGTDRYNCCLGKRKNAENSLVAALTTEDKPSVREFCDRMEATREVAALRRMIADVRPQLDSAIKGEQWGIAAEKDSFISGLKQAICVIESCTAHKEDE